MTFDESIYIHLEDEAFEEQNAREIALKIFDSLREFIFLHKGLLEETGCFSIAIKRCTRAGLHRLYPSQQIEIIKAFFKSQQVLKLYYASLSAEARAFIQQLSSSPFVSNEEAKKIFGEGLLEEAPATKGELSLKPQYVEQWGYTLHVKSSQSADSAVGALLAAQQPIFALPRFIRYSFLSLLLTNTSKLRLRPTQVPTDYLRYSNEGEILQDFLAIQSALEEESIHITSNKWLIKASSIKSYVKRSASSPLPGTAPHIKALLIASRLVCSPYGKNPVYTIPDKVEELIQVLFDQVDIELACFTAILHRFKGNRLIERQHTSLLHLIYSVRNLHALLTDQWYLLSALLEYMEAQFMIFTPLFKYDIDRLQLPSKSYQSSTFSEGTLIQQKKVIRHYSIIGALQLMAAYGLVELAYPEQSAPEALPFYAVRLTPLGLYGLDKTPVYKN